MTRYAYIQIKENDDNALKQALASTTAHGKRFDSGSD